MKDKKSKVLTQEEIARSKREFAETMAAHAKKQREEMGLEKPSEIKDEKGKVKMVKTTAGPKSKKGKGILTTLDTQREIADVPLRSSGGFLSTDGMSDSSIITQYATHEEMTALAKTVKERLADRPKFTFWICKKCGGRIMSGPNAIEPMTCLECNWPGYTDGGWMRPMSKKEIEQFKKDKATKDKRDVERIKRAGFNAANQSRATAGLKPFTMKEYEEESKRAYRESLERSRR